MCRDTHAVNRIDHTPLLTNQYIMLVKFIYRNKNRIEVVSVRNKNFHKTIGDLIYFQNGDLSYEWIFDGISVIHQNVMEEILLKLKELNS